MVDYVYKGLSGVHREITIADPTTSTIGDLIVAIAADEGLPTDYYSFSINGNTSINDSELDDSTTTIDDSEITAESLIVCSPRQDGDKTRRQIQKLEIAQVKKQAFGDTNASYYRSLNTYDIDLLPTKYDGNYDLIDNANTGGLVAGRPWT